MRLIKLGSKSPVAMKARCLDWWSSLRRRLWQSLLYAFTAFSVMWTVIEGVTEILEVEIKGVYVFIVVILVSVTFSLKRSWKPSSIVIKVATTDTKIEVLFGDLFAQEGLRGIAATQYFESEFGDPVSQESLLGIFLQKHFGGGAIDFDNQLEQQLQTISSQHIKDKSVGKKKSYPIGTTALIQVNDRKYLLFAFTEADPQTCKANSDVGKMWTAMHGLWQRARNESGGLPLNIPLIGSGLSGIGLPARELLNLIVLSVITETKVKQITKTIRIVLLPERFEEIDLRDLKKYWEES